MAAPDSNRSQKSRGSSGAPTALAWEAARAKTDLSWAQIEARLRKPLPTPTIELWVVRHGETTANAQGLVTGTSNPSLTGEGHRQARDAGLELSGHRFEIAWHSSLRRSRETLTDVLDAGGIAVSSILEDDRIRERGLGELELAPARPIAQFACGDLSYAPPGGESYEEVTRRCLAFLIDLIVMANSLNRGTKLLVCSHMGPMRILAGILDRIADPREVLKLHFGNSSPRKFEIDELEFPVFLTSFRRLGSQATA